MQAHSEISLLHCSCSPGEVALSLLDCSKAEILCSTRDVSATALSNGTGSRRPTRSCCQWRMHHSYMDKTQFCFTLSLAWPSCNADRTLLLKAVIKTLKQLLCHGDVESPMAGGFVRKANPCITRRQLECSDPRQAQKVNCALCIPLSCTAVFLTCFWASELLCSETGDEAEEVAGKFAAEPSE